MLTFVLVSVAFAAALVDVTLGRSNGSYEHELRKLLLTDYDSTVRPPPSPNSTAIQITFELKINRLVEVDDKEQIFVVHTWVVMQWNNSFFSWDIKKYGGKDHIHFLPSEVWFPDISLYNNADASTPRAGGRSKFLSNVIVDNNGVNRWSGPSSFTASCDLSLKYWPFDVQTCDLRFGSLSYDSTQLQIVEFGNRTKKKSDIGKNSNWLIELRTSSKIGENDFGDCCKFPFSQISYSVTITRRSTYYMFYMVCPCLALAFLTLVSFWIPSESGERIGFVITLLLGMMVFLLVVPESLPVSSESIPILGLLMMGTMVMIIGVLMATIVVLRCFHATGRPPKYLQGISRQRKKRATITSITVEPRKSPQQERSDLSLGDAQPRSQEPRDNNSFERSPADHDITWEMISYKLDKLFFWVCLACFAVMYVVLMILPRYRTSE